MPSPRLAVLAPTITLFLIAGGVAFAQSTSDSPGFISVCNQRSGSLESVGDLNVLLNTACAKGQKPFKLATFPVAATPGPAGPKGDKGDKGGKGDTGARGPQGPKGEEGPRGAHGAKGDDGERGPRGPDGPQGAKGNRGEQGEQGEQGPKGDDGAKGAPGISDYSVHVNAPAPNQNRYKSVQIDCPDGTMALGGGGQVKVPSSNDHGVVLVSSYNRNDGWFAQAEANASVDFDWSVAAHVICAKVAG